MFVSIRTKLFILLVLANALMVAVLLTLNALTFSHSFSSYVAQQESRKLAPLIDNIATSYDEQGNWDWLRPDSARWLNTLRQSFAPGELNRMDRMNNNKRPNPPPRNGYLERLRIKDSENQIVLGRRNGMANTIWLEIESHQTGELVGFLGFEPSARLDAQFDQLFRSRLKGQVLAIGLVAIAIAALLALPFSGWLVKPIRRLNKALRQLTGGDLLVSVAAGRNDELGQLAAEFNRLAGVLNQNHQDRQHWVSDIAHELRTPVAVLMADIEAAQDGVRQVDATWLHAMHGHSDRLNRLINDLHQLSQSDAGALNYRFEVLDLAELTGETIGQYRASCQQQHIDVDWQMPDRPVWVRGDDKRLVQLLTNLLHNSLRYTDGSLDRPGRLRVRLASVAGHSELIWEDSNPGVGPDDLAKLFDRLYRVDESRSRASGGSGLGLAIVKNIIEAHDARIEASCSPLGGLRLLIQFTTVQENHR
ncbi:ATP-binding protein [Reinekea sp.]|jgi:two-component system sensor histidine kinase BaeS|uniref:ATP-binding protein n=1 Tax=Reinekea sp. TaxID=1970455 RepID=UPI002A813D56|nr:ATP-binding protein [Reinekea sp.]